MDTASQTPRAGQSPKTRVRCSVLRIEIDNAYHQGTKTLCIYGLGFSHGHSAECSTMVGSVHLRIRLIGVSWFSTFGGKLTNDNDVLSACCHTSKFDGG